MNKIKLNVAEVFSSIQGEGRTTGTPSVFLRLANCNLLCKSKDWICDSIEVWQKGEMKGFDQVFNLEQIADLNDGAHLVITGGEPMLQQRKLVDFIKHWQSRILRKIFIEIETNGTIMPNEEMLQLVSQWNCSPKLANSGEKKQRRFKPEVLRVISKTRNHFFKFVINQKSDVFEIRHLFDEAKIVESKKNIYLMPAGETRKELNAVRDMVVNQSKEFSFQYSDRLHIVIWNKKTGV
jgi:organic radical activating enzyme